MQRTHRILQGGGMLRVLQGLQTCMGGMYDAAANGAS